MLILYDTQVPDRAPRRLVEFDASAGALSPRTARAIRAEARLAKLQAFITKALGVRPIRPATCSTSRLLWLSAQPCLTISSLRNCSLQRRQDRDVRRHSRRRERHVSSLDSSSPTRSTLTHSTHNPAPSAPSAASSLPDLHATHYLPATNLKFSFPGHTTNSVNRPFRNRPECATSCAYRKRTVFRSQLSAVSGQQEEPNDGPRTGALESWSI